MKRIIAMIAASLATVASGQTGCLAPVSTFEVPDLQFADVHVSGTVAHVGAWGEYVSLDVSDPANPTLIDRVPLPALDGNEPRDLLYNRVRSVGDIVVAGAEASGGFEGGLHVLLTDGDGGVLDRLTFNIGVTPIGGLYDIAAHGDSVFLLINGALTSISSDQLLALFALIPNRLIRPLSDFFITGAETIQTGGYEYDFAMVGQEFFVSGSETGGQSSVRRVTAGGISEVTPGQVYALGEGPSETLLVNRLGINRFMIFDTDNLAVPIYNSPLEEYITQMNNLGNLLIAAADVRGLKVFDLSDLSAPFELDRVGEFVRRADVDGHLVYAIEHVNDFMGLLIFDVSACLDGAVSCPGDIADDFGTVGNADGQVSFGDFLALLGLVGPCPGVTPGCDGDIADDFGTPNGGDGMVSFGDFLALLGLVGPCP